MAAAAVPEDGSSPPATLSAIEKMKRAAALAVAEKKAAASELSVER